MILQYGKTFKNSLKKSAVGCVFRSAIVSTWLQFFPLALCLQEVSLSVAAEIVVISISILIIIAVRALR